MTSTLDLGLLPSWGLYFLDCTAAVTLKIKPLNSIKLRMTCGTRLSSTNLSKTPGLDRGTSESRLVLSWGGERVIVVPSWGDSPRRAVRGRGGSRIAWGAACCWRRESRRHGWGPTHTEDLGVHEFEGSRRDSILELLLLNLRLGRP